MLYQILPKLISKLSSIQITNKIVRSDFLNLVDHYLGLIIIKFNILYNFQKIIIDIKNYNFLNF